MKILDGILYLEFREAVKAGISEKTIKNGKSEHRDDWNFITDPSDSRKVLLEYETLKEKYKKLIQYEFGNPYVYHNNQLLKAFIIPLKEDLNNLRAYRLPNGSHLPKNKIKSYWKSSSVLHFLTKCDKDYVKTLGFSSKDDLMQAVKDFADHHNISIPVSYSKLRAKVREYQAHGPTCLISKKYCNNNSRKLSDLQQQYLIYLYGDHTKPDVPKVHQLYNAEANKHNWSEIEESTVRKFLNLPGVKQKWYRSRHGVIPWKDLYGHSITKATPSVRDAKWESDGSRLNLCYVDENGQPNPRMEIYLVIDVYSKAILGYHLSFSESHLDVYKAYRHAINKSQRRPYQLLYDKGSANMSGASQEFFDRIAHAHFPAQPHNGQSKIIESVLFTLQSKFLKDFPNFTGQNITTKTENSHLNKEWFGKNWKKFPNKDGVMRQAQLAIAAYNHTKGKDDLTPFEKYDSSVNEKTEQIGLLDMVDMFWLKRKDPVTYRKDGITINIKGEKLRFSVLDQNDLPDLDFMESHLQDKFDVKYDPWDMNQVRLFKNDAFVAEARRKAALPSAVMDYKEGDAAKIRKHIDVRRNQLKRNEESMDQVKGRIDAEGLLRLGFENTHKEALNRAEGDYLVEEFIDKPIDLFKDEDLDEGKIIE